MGPEHTLSDARRALTHVDREGRREPEHTLREATATAAAPYEPDRLERMFLRQLLLQREGRALDPPGMRGEERGWYVTWNHTALIKELGEALDEVAWKPWSTDKDSFNRKQYLGELVDAFHFLMNMILVAAGAAYSDNVTAAEIASEFFGAYLKKSEINMERFTSGTYDSKATKCPDCGREVREQERDPMRDRTEIREHTWQDELGYRGDVVTMEYEAYRCPSPCGRVNYVPAIS